MSESARFVSFRKTRSGDFLIFEAAPYKHGIGVRKVGSEGGGYTTGYQFGRANTEPEAKAAAEALVAEMTDDFSTWQVVEWQPPMQKNPQFVDLPKQYPINRVYESKPAAEADGWIYINPTKTIEHYRGRVIKCIDISPGNSFGYNFALRIWGEDEDFAISQELRIGEFQGTTRFRSGDIVDAILAAREWIDNDLITIKMAADLTGKSIQSISQMVMRDTLTGYKNPDATGVRQGGTMVSRSQLCWLGIIEIEGGHS